MKFGNAIAVGVSQVGVSNLLLLQYFSLSIFQRLEQQELPSLLAIWLNMGGQILDII